MLSEICDFIHNYFVKNTISGTFSISNGNIDVEGLLEGQRFRIYGSAMNDGVYTYHSTGIMNDDDNKDAELADESFTGYIGYMAVPRALFQIADSISDWIKLKEENGVSGIYTSESFGGYSYTLNNGVDAHGYSQNDWRSVFGSSLNAWRKIG